MANEQIQGQQKAFEEAKNSLAKELSPEMLLWDFSKMMEELRRVIKDKAPNKNDNWGATRSFARHYLKMGGDERFKKVLSWFKGEVMSAEEIRLVLTALNKLGEVKNSSHDDTSSNKPIQTVGIPRAKRMLVDHTRGIFSSLARLLIESGVTTDDVYDGDRMQIKEAVRNIFTRLGVEVYFQPEKQGEPLTRQDMANLGLKKERRKK